MTFRLKQAEQRSAIYYGHYLDLDLSGQSRRAL